MKAMTKTAAVASAVVVAAATKRCPIPRYAYVSPILFHELAIY